MKELLSAHPLATALVITGTIAFCLVVLVFVDTRKEK